jgi:hypothetical protein
VKTSILWILIILSLNALAQSLTEDNPLDLGEEKIKVRFEQKKMNQKSITYQDLTHPNLGCPENSICDQAMGSVYQKLIHLTDQIKKQKLNPSQVLSRLRPFFKEHGQPIYFLALKESYQHFGPILFNSKCEHHNSKDKPIIYKAMAFSSGLDPKKQIKLIKPSNRYHVPIERVISLPRVDVDHGEKIISYYLPLGEKPIYINGDNIVFTSEFNDVIWNTEVSPHGNWSQIYQAKLSSLVFMSGEKTNCPTSFPPTQPDSFYQFTYCHKIYDIKNKKEKIARVQLDCL